MERANTVAVVVPSPATSEVLEATSFTIWAPMFSNLSGSSISFATVTPSFVTVGAPHDFSSTTLRPRGPSVTVTASASTCTPCRSLARASWLKFTIFGMALCPPFLGSALDHAEDVFLAHDEILRAVDGDLGAGILAEQDAIAFLQVELVQLSVVVDLPLTDRHDLAFLRFLFGGIGDDDPARGLFFFLDALHDYPVLQRTNVHDFFASLLRVPWPPLGRGGTIIPSIAARDKTGKP